MNKLRLILSVFALFVLSSTAVQAQQKIGYCKTEFVVGNWPKIKSAENTIMTLQKQHEKLIKQKEDELQRMQEEFMQAQQSGLMTPEIQEEKMLDYQLAEKDYQLQVKRAQREIEKKTNETLSPLMQEVFVAIEEVAKDKGFTLVINSMAAQQAYVVLYAKNESDDITVAVLEKLGVDTTEIKKTYSFELGK